MKAIILAAGYATRLYPLTINTPKALLPIDNIPLINHIINKIQKISEIDEIFIITNDKFHINFSEWLDQHENEFEIKIKIINDQTLTNETRLGAIGDINFAIESEKIDDDIFVMAGDNLFNFDLKEMVEYFKKINNTLIGLYDVEDIEEIKKFSVVETQNNKIIHFEEKPENPKSTISSTAIYIYSKSDLKIIQDYMKTDNSKDAPGYFIQYLFKIKDVHGFELKGKWFDIGSHETYNKVKKGL